MAIPWGGKLTAYEGFPLSHLIPCEPSTTRKGGTTKGMKKYSMFEEIVRQCSSFFTLHLRTTLVKSAAAKRAHMIFTSTLTCNWLGTRMHLPSPLSTAS